MYHYSLIGKIQRLQQLHRKAMYQRSRDHCIKQFPKGAHTLAHNLENQTNMTPIGPLVSEEFFQDGNMFVSGMIHVSCFQVLHDLELKDINASTVAFCAEDFHCPEFLSTDCT